MRANIVIYFTGKIPRARIDGIFDLRLLGAIERNFDSVTIQFCGVTRRIFRIFLMHTSPTTAWEKASIAWDKEAREIGESKIERGRPCDKSRSHQIPLRRFRQTAVDHYALVCAILHCPSPLYTFVPRNFTRRAIY